MSETLQQAQGTALRQAQGEPLRHNDCLNFLPVDVAKGFCRRTDELILTDSETCEHFNALPKCKNCAQFLPQDGGALGVCRAEKSQPWTFKDLIAVTSEMYVREAEAAPAAEA